MSMFLNVVEQQYERIAELKRGDVQALERWISGQPHLPQAPEPLLMQMLCSCNFDMVATKQCIEYYYTIRASFPVVFTNRDPLLPINSRCLSTFVCEPFPSLTKDGCGVLYSKLIDPTLEKFDYLVLNKLFDMRLHLWLKEVGCVNGVHIIIDMDGTTLRHVQKMSYFNLRKTLGYLTEGLPVKIKGFHYVQPTNFVDYFFKLLYPLISKELRAMLHVHHGEEVFDYLPRNCVPDDLDGTGGTIASLHASFVNALTENREYFLDDERWKADESKRVKEGFLKRFGW